MTREISKVLGDIERETVSAATAMRSTTEHVTEIMVPIAATASRNAAAAQEAALSTNQLAISMNEIGSTARSLRDQAEAFEALLAAFTVDAPAAKIAPIARNAYTIGTRT